MGTLFTEVGARFRVITTRGLARMGMTEESFLLLPAVLIGVLAAAAGVAFHESINAIRDLLYAHVDPGFLYGHGVWMLILWPALGGLLVGLIGRVFGPGGHGVPDVIESVIRTQGFMKPIAAVQTLIASSITIGTGGSAGAEGPIVQIGAAISSAVGRLFCISRQHMPILIGCGTAAGISAVFNSPIGGVLFTLEVILQDFSIRTFAPLVVASVIANVTTAAIFRNLVHRQYNAIFSLPDMARGFGPHGFAWGQLPNFALLGLACGLIAVGLTLLMLKTQAQVSRWRTPKLFRPALGGAAVGVMGALFVIVLGWWMLARAKPFDFSDYPMPAFFGDGYGVIQDLLSPQYYVGRDASHLLVLLLVLCGAKLLGTCLTLATGGSGGIIAPSLFLGATTGAVLGLIFQKLHLFSEVYPATYALIGMGAALGAVVHAPLAAILILLELTGDYHIIVPAMLATIVATGAARFIFPESVYTVEVRARGIRLGSARELSLLRKVSVEQVGMEPALIVPYSMPLVEVLRRLGQELRDAVVVDPDGHYLSILRHEDIELALFQPDSLPLLVAGELARPEVPILSSMDDLSRALEAFSQARVGTLAVSVPESPLNVVGVISHQFLMRRYHELLDQK
jgi:chloride channel protein, CIC family